MNERDLVGIVYMNVIMLRIDCFLIHPFSVWPQYGQGRIHTTLGLSFIGSNMKTPLIPLERTCYLLIVHIEH
jgi:hypothetical protein